MRVPDPVPGLVVRYSFLWSREAAVGASEGAKDRPCAIIVAVRTEQGGVRTVVAPITHTPPRDPEDARPVPPEVSRGLGLDDAPKWVVYDELNSFDWPGFDLRPIPGTGRFDYGMLPKDFFEALRRNIVARNAAKKARATRRDA
jgi:mRNA-degrading endonuclease toxin of MazEF toxin-antitoxin module